MAEVRSLGKGKQKPRKLELDKEVFDLLQQTNPIEPDSNQISSHPLMQCIEKSCVMLIFPEKMVNKFISSLTTTDEPETD